MSDEGVLAPGARPRGHLPADRRADPRALGDLLMRSEVARMTTLPKVTITPAAGGWLVSCDRCADETWHPRRPGADRAAHEHRASHARKGVGS